MMKFSGKANMGQTTFSRIEVNKYLDTSGGVRSIQKAKSNQIRELRCHE